MKTETKFKLPTYYDEDLGKVVNTKIAVGNDLIRSLITPGRRLKDSARVVADAFIENLQVLSDGFEMARELNGQRIFYTITIEDIECSVEAKRKDRGSLYSDVYDSVRITKLV